MISTIAFILFAIVAIAMGIFTISEKEKEFTCLFLGFGFCMLICAILDICGTPIFQLEEFIMQ